MMFSPVLSSGRPVALFFAKFETHYLNFCQLISLVVSQNSACLSQFDTFQVAYCTLVRIPAGTGKFSLHSLVETGSGAHQASHPVGTRGSFPGGKSARAWSWLLTSI